jgi:hypothetical protein
MTIRRLEEQMYRAEQFAAYFIGQGLKPNSLNNYQVVLRKADQAIGGLDEKLTNEGGNAVLRWAQTATPESLRPYLKDLPAITKKYIEFFEVSESNPDPTAEGSPENPPEPTGGGFRIEREMQAAVRRQLASLEPGLKEADSCFEASVATGKIDILAEDAQGRLVVIELKAGLCPAGALEQTAGYAEALSEERGRPVRAYLIAADFPNRLRTAARRMRDLELRSYEFSLRLQVVP